MDLMGTPPRQDPVELATADVSERRLASPVFDDGRTAIPEDVPVFGGSGEQILEEKVETERSAMETSQTSQAMSYPMCRLEKSLAPGSRPDFKRSASCVSTASKSRVLIHGHSFDMDATSCAGWVRFMFAQMLKSPAFDFVIGCFILGNSVLVGVELTGRTQGQSTPRASALENPFLCIFVAELAIRFATLGHQCLRDNWVKFDLASVLAGVVTKWILEPLEPGGLTENGIQLVTIVRTARLLRLARPLRLVPQFRELWLLVRGLLDSGSTMVYTLFLLCLMLYIFGCIGVEILTTHRLAHGPDAHPEFQLIVEEHFSSIPVAMITLVQFACLDGFAEIWKPMVLLDYTLVPYFVSCLLVIGIVLMNIITAVIVQGAFQSVDEDREVMNMKEGSKKKKLIRDVRKMFLRLDVEGSGAIGLDEIEGLNDDDRALFFSAFTTSEPTEIFAALDVDETGELGIDDLCDGIWQATVSKVPIEIKRMEKQVQAMRGQLRVLMDAREFNSMLREKLDEMQVTLDNVALQCRHASVPAPTTTPLASARCATTQWTTSNLPNDADSEAKPLGRRKDKKMSNLFLEARFGTFDKQDTPKEPDQPQRGGSPPETGHPPATSDDGKVIEPSEQAQQGSTGLRDACGGSEAELRRMPSPCRPSPFLEGSQLQDAGDVPPKFAFSANGGSRSL